MSQALDSILVEYSALQHLSLGRSALRVSLVEARLALPAAPAVRSADPFGGRSDPAGLAHFWNGHGLVYRRVRPGLLEKAGEVVPDEGVHTVEGFLLPRGYPLVVAHACFVQAAHLNRGVWKHDFSCQGGPVSPGCHAFRVRCVTLGWTGFQSGAPITSSASTAGQRRQRPGQQRQEQRRPQRKPG